MSEVEEQLWEGQNLHCDEVVGRSKKDRIEMRCALVSCGNELTLQCVYKVPS